MKFRSTRVEGKRGPRDPAHYAAALLLLEPIDDCAYIPMYARPLAVYTRAAGELTGH